MSARNLIITGGPTHDLAETSSQLAGLLDTEGITSVIDDDLGSAFDALAESGQRWDLVTINTLRWRMEAERYADLQPEWGVSTDPAWEQALENHVSGGGGLLAVHTAVISFDDSAAWHSLCGASWNWDRSHHPPLGPVHVELTPDGSGHPVTADAPGEFTIVDEAYCDLDVDGDVIPLATASVAGSDQPLVWAKQVGEGRVVVDLLGHDPMSFREPAHTAIVRGAARWACRQAGEEEAT